MSVSQEKVGPLLYDMYEQLQRLYALIYAAGNIKEPGGEHPDNMLQLLSEIGTEEAKRIMDEMWALVEYLADELGVDARPAKLPDESEVQS